MLEENTADSKSKRPNVLGIVHAGSHHKDAARIPRFSGSSNELKSAFVIAKVVIEKHKIDNIAGQGLNRFLSRRAMSHDLESGLGIQETVQHRAKERVIIEQQQ